MHSSSKDSLAASTGAIRQPNYSGALVPVKPSSANSSTGRRTNALGGSRKSGSVEYGYNSYHVPPLQVSARADGGSAGGSGGLQGGRAGRLANSTAAATGSGKRKSLISKSQRDALQISAFGFNTQKGRSPLLDGDNASDLSSRAKATLKSLHTTGNEKVVVAGDEKSSVRFQLCVEALAEGCVQTYIHLFHLSHRGPVCVDELSKRYFTIPDEKLRWVQEQLSAIEVLRRQSEFDSVFERCVRLADYFEGERDMAEAVWHYEAALRYSMESLDRSLEQDVRGTFAAFYERVDKKEEAAQLYESMFRQATALDDEERARFASLQLVRVYQALGDDVRRRNPDAARAYYEKAAKCAQRSQSGVAEGRAFDALGKINEQTGQLDKALFYQRNFRMVSRRERMLEDECQAVLNVAGLEERLGKNEDATQSLNEALELAKQLGDDEKICRATMQLGEVCRRAGNEEGARRCFEEAFRAACASGVQELMDRTRVSMGFARGEFFFVHAAHDTGYVPIVCNDIAAQLAWMSNGEL